jgi:hypothetical protein
MACSSALWVEVNRFDSGTGHWGEVLRQHNGFQNRWPGFDSRHPCHAGGVR